VFGTAFQRGYAHGLLLSDIILDFVNTKLPDFLKGQVDRLPLSKLPDWLQKIVKEQLEKNVWQAFNTVCEWVYSQESEYINASLINFTEEVTGLAQGVCFNRTKAACDPDSFSKELIALNMFPELIRMQCSMLSAWGDSTPDGCATQLRTLDFGTGPFANATFLIVHHPDQGFPFAEVGFPAFVGAVTGFSPHIGLSQKVDDVTDSHKPYGSYNGKPDAIVIREILQFATSKEAAVQIAQKAKRTWGIWLGFGDFQSQRFLTTLYDQLEVIPYDDVTLPFATSQPFIKEVAYVDKHPQPSSAPELPALIKQMYGNMSALNVAQNIPRLTQSGDVHIAVYDFGKQEVYVSRGLTNATGDFIQYAYEAPFLRWNMSSLWKISL